MIKAVFYFDDNTVTIHSENTKHVTTKFESGYYLARLTQDGNLRITCVDFKEVHPPFPNQKASEVLDSIGKFLNEENMIKSNSMGYTYKLNVLLYGKQGVGKTALINYISHGMMVNHNAIVFRVDSQSNLEPSWALAEEIRKVQDNPIIFILDEFEQYCGKSSEGYIKNLTDGNRSINNSIVFAATNYIDRIPVTLKERPSRFRIVSEIEPIKDKEIIRDLITKTHDKCEVAFLSEKDIQDIVKNINSTTVDQLKTILIDKLMNLALGLPDKVSIGFAKNDEVDDDINESRGDFQLLSDLFSSDESSNADKRWRVISQEKKEFKIFDKED